MVNATPRPSQLTRGKDAVPFVQEAGCSSGPVWTGKKSLPGRPVRSKMLYRLLKPARPWWMYQTIQCHIHGNILTTKAVKSKISRITLLPIAMLCRSYGTGVLNIQSWRLPRVSDTRQRLLCIWKCKRLKRSCPRKRRNTNFWMEIDEHGL